MEEFKKDSFGSEIPVCQNCYQKQYGNFQDTYFDSSEDTKYVQYSPAPKTKRGLIIFIIMLAFVAFISYSVIYSTIFADDEGNQATNEITTSVTTEFISEN